MLTRSYLPKDLLTVDEAAAYARCSASTIKRRIHAGQLPAYRHERRYFISPADLDALFKPTAPAGDPLERVVRAIVAEAPRLSEESRNRIASLLREA